MDKLMEKLTEELSKEPPKTLMDKLMELLLQGCYLFHLLEEVVSVFHMSVIISLK